MSIYVIHGTSLIDAVESAGGFDVHVAKPVEPSELVAMSRFGHTRPPRRLPSKDSPIQDGP